MTTDKPHQPPPHEANVSNDERKGIRDFSLQILAALVIMAVSGIGTYLVTITSVETRMENLSRRVEKIESARDHEARERLRDTKELVKTVTKISTTVEGFDRNLKDFQKSVDHRFSFRLRKTSMKRFSIISVYTQLSCQAICSPTGFAEYYGACYLIFI